MCASFIDNFCDSDMSSYYYNVISFQQMFESFIVSLMKKASKDKRYGMMRNDDHHSHENMPSHDGRRHCMGETYPPSIRNQPTSRNYAPRERVDSNSFPQSRSSNCCC